MCVLIYLFMIRALAYWAVSFKQMIYKIVIYFTDLSISTLFCSAVYTILFSRLNGQVILRICSYLDTLDPVYVT